MEKRNEKRTANFDINDRLKHTDFGRVCASAHRAPPALTIASANRPCRLVVSRNVHSFTRVR